MSFSRAPRSSSTLWLWSAPLDALAFLVPVGLALVVIFLVQGGAIGSEQPAPLVVWLLAVVGVDVAHVWSTLLRTYADSSELRRHPQRYLLTPVGSFLVALALHSYSAMLFWRALAYLAVVHFIRQQAGWMAIHRARATDRTRLSKLLDELVIYLSAGVPLLAWHVRPELPFHWFVEGDFILLPSLAQLLPLAYGALLVAWVLFLGRVLWGWRRTGVLPLGKVLVASMTLASWLGGIVLFRSDLAFTLLNVLPHGIPYMMLLWFYGCELAASPEGARTAAGVVVRHGALLALAALWGIALWEEMSWDITYWHDHEALWPWGTGVRWERISSLLVALLATPQLTHYVLDAVLWRRGSATPAQGRALGFQGPPRLGTWLPAEGMLRRMLRS